MRPGLTCVGICCHQVRATLFGPVVGGLGECASLRHLLPEDPLWQRAASGLVAVINAGLPAGTVRGWSAGNAGLLLAALKQGRGSGDAGFGNCGMDWCRETSARRVARRWQQV